MLRTLKRLDGVLDEDAIAKQVQTLYYVFVPAAVTLEDKHGHIEWLQSHKATRDWTFWQRYREYLLDNQGLPDKAVERLDDVTDQILRLLEIQSGPEHGTDGEWSSARCSRVKLRTTSA